MDQNQRIENAERVVKQHIYENASVLVSDLFNNGDYQDDLMELMSRTVWECDCCGHQSTDCKDLDECCDQATAGESDQSEVTAEVYEHWIVSDWLGRQLEKRGEIVGEFKGLTIWGRTCTGQAIFLDEVIQEIGSL